MITETVEDNIFKNFKEYVEDKLKLSNEEFIDITTSPHFTEAMCLLYKEITESPLYKEMYGSVVKKESFIKDDRYGFCEMEKEIDNPISENSHDVHFNMKHLYSYSEYYEADEGRFIEDVGEFRSYEPSLEKLSPEAKAIYETLKESNKKTPT